jgi:phage FluMu protein Com
MTDLAKAYFQWYKGSKEHEWARDRIEEIFDDDIDKAWEVTLELIDAAPSKESLYYVAAGQLETLVSKSGSELLERIKQEARCNKKLLFAMTGIYIDEKNPVCDEYLKFVSDEQGIRTPEDVNRLVELPDK